jgi:hypothetical protein
VLTRRERRVGRPLKLCWISTGGLSHCNSILESHTSRDPPSDTFLALMDEFHMHERVVPKKNLDVFVRSDEFEVEMTKKNQ